MLCAVRCHAPSARARSTRELRCILLRTVFNLLLPLLLLLLLLQARFFEDEIRPHLKHKRKGLLGMAGVWSARRGLQACHAGSCLHFPAAAAAAAVVVPPAMPPLQPCACACRPCRCGGEHEWISILRHHRGEPVQPG